MYALAGRDRMRKELMNIRTKVLLVVALLGLAAPATAGVPSAADIKLTKVVDASKLPTDVQGYSVPGQSTVVLVFYTADPAEHAPNTFVFVGTNKLLFQQTLRNDIGGRSSRGNDDPNWSLANNEWTISSLAPRSKQEYEFGIAELRRRQQKVEVICAGYADGVELTLLTPAAVQAIISKATFRTSAIVRRPVALSRDDSGVYYYVDRLRDDLGGEGFRVFVGKRGAMKQLPLVDVANDAAGMVFATGKGDLRLTINAEKPNEPATTVWANKKNTVTLRNVGIGPVSSYLIHRDLGVYGSMGVFCDER